MNEKNKYGSKAQKDWAKEKGDTYKHWKNDWDESKKLRYLTDKAPSKLNDTSEIIKNIKFYIDDLVDTYEEGRENDENIIWSLPELYHLVKDLKEAYWKLNELTLLEQTNIATLNYELEKGNKQIEFLKSQVKFVEGKAKDKMTLEDKQKQAIENGEGYTCPKCYEWSQGGCHCNCEKKKII